MPTKTAKRNSPFEIAREALGHVGKFQTPPTPSVYEVWYRYVEGVDDIIANLSHAVEDVNAVSVDMLEQLHKQYCVHIEDTNTDLSENLASEMTSLQSILESQMNAGKQLGSELDEACVTLQETPATAQSIAECAQKMLTSSNTMQDQIRNLQTQLQASQSKVEALQTELNESRAAVMTDPLTNLGNRRHFDLHIRQSLLLARTESRYSFLLLVDLDHFKHINDTFGHDCGDKVIMYVASQLTHLCPDSPISRLGGDEFAIILRSDDYAEATDTAAEIRQYFASTPLKLSGSGEDLGKIELSIGGARLRKNDDGQSWFVRADKLLYQAKNAGRNSVMLEHSR
ncbi:GGDEF domain-containing protein [Rhodopirellula sp. SWK7]|uniref:GGDEF domain-containing protein n=1 Tax=Rhodopirellula sp. SWK7 TaxID=595460 RepID=UPI0002BEB9E8|nr:GGDEF domain-containing protein [Rhodopirellula sp. SWK7]EMI40553.1 GGDEF domain-containing protein [Rhodopirellula sp. SWK7]